MSGDKGRQTTVGRLPRKAAQGEPVETPRCKKEHKIEIIKTLSKSKSRKNKINEDKK